MLKSWNITAVLRYTDSTVLFTGYALMRCPLTSGSTFLVWGKRLPKHVTRREKGGGAGERGCSLLQSSAFNTHIHTKRWQKHWARTRWSHHTISDSRLAHPRGQRSPAARQTQKHNQTHEKLERRDPSLGYDLTSFDITSLAGGWAASY